MRKVDLWLIPWLCLLYLLSFLDRTNIGQFREMEKEKEKRKENHRTKLTISQAMPVQLEWKKISIWQATITTIL